GRRTRGARWAGRRRDRDRGGGGRRGDREGRAGDGVDVAVARADARGAPGRAARRGPRVRERGGAARVVGAAVRGPRGVAVDRGSPEVPAARTLGGGAVRVGATGGGAGGLAGEGA